MIDSVLKGTGNSRFLKSAVPAGTSWADALAMLQAGTFPIDFNGINTEGFQQVGTPLNKANLLKDATAAQIGLPPSTTPDGMFQALGNTGELHVWRKTVVTSNDVPAGYTLGAGEQTTLIIKSQYGSGTQYANVEYGNTCAVYDNGEPYIPNSITTSNFTVTNSSTLSTLNNTLKGKFCRFHAVSGSNRLTVSDGVFFIPSNATFQNEIPTSGDTKITVDVAQKVNAYPLTPAGTTTTYPVSTNPKAYQEGDDAKAAGYVVGEVVTGKFGMGMRYASTVFEYSVASEISASDDGTISLKNPTTFTIGSSSGYPGVAGNVTAAIAGKYIQLKVMGSATSLMSGPFSSAPSSIVYIPSDTIATREDIKNGNTQTWYFIDRYQPVTGYAAIPAGTTIEYLGKLGDKGRMQTLTYVGTGTYGSEADPITLTFPFAPKYARYIYNFEFAEIPLTSLKSGSYTKAFWGTTTSGRPVPTKISEDRKTLSWYGNYGADYASNSQGTKYHILIIG